MDAVQEWKDAQGRVIELVEGLATDAAETTVPACPDWSVRDLLSHMIGLDADVLAGDEPDDHNETWTARQVDQRRGHDIATLIAEWRSITDPLASWMQEHSTRPLGDVVIHEQDLRAALDAPGARDTDGLRALRDRMADGFDARVRDAGAPTIELRSPDWKFVAGEGAPTVRMEASDFDLTRALMSRRSADQLRAWTTVGNIEEHLDLFAGLGPLPHDAPPE
ncbi:maleylpyruvate isomerase family mycothiol-dependent enzyme [Allobranchiibius sp. CTAmp26]|uniref:maleylpyruvate isomerase family mycothiol-dependent enzyme n=1 Tax=Allobranchiibius sp. CTAmp26 TaxID=2815214 RepID=UPI001AA1337D|nr:maleylpyruvate isomerase family mycothiol-dependent enzyme [Allobranchiibius sp. CTAmp26]MBO1753628.1 maleylpyruvate isomerase family mycothiol-dependent enzyme [Allobranchiibius sp. CTAmp26]